MKKQNLTAKICFWCEPQFKKDFKKAVKKAKLKEGEFIREAIMKQLSNKPQSGLGK